MQFDYDGIIKNQNRKTMKPEHYLARFGKIQRPPKHPLEGVIIRSETSDHREVRPSCFPIEPARKAKRG